MVKKIYRILLIVSFMLFIIVLFQNKVYAGNNLNDLSASGDVDERTSGTYGQKDKYSFQPAVRIGKLGDIHDRIQLGSGSSDKPMGRIDYIFFKEKENRSAMEGDYVDISIRIEKEAGNIILLDDEYSYNKEEIKVINVKCDSNKEESHIKISLQLLHRTSEENEEGEKSLKYTILVGDDRI